MNWLQTLSGPLIGAVIGYGTNYIAVKMLFRPLHPVKLGSWTLPFTPGVIPRRKRALAAALGHAVGRDLIGVQEITDALLGERMKSLVSEGMGTALDELLDSDRPVKELLEEYSGPDAYEQHKAEMILHITDKIAGKFEQMDIGSMIVEQGSVVLKEKTQGTMLAMFVNDELIASMAEPVGEKMNEYIRLDGREEIRSFAGAEVERLEHSPMSALTGNWVDRKRVRDQVELLYERFIRERGAEVAQSIDLVKIVEDKVNDMDVADVEKLVLSVMEKELGMIVRLGALIGFVIGLLNLLC